MFFDWTQSRNLLPTLLSSFHTLRHADADADADDRTEKPVLWFSLQFSFFGASWSKSVSYQTHQLRGTGSSFAQMGPNGRKIIIRSEQCWLLWPAAAAAAAAAAGSELRLSETISCLTKEHPKLDHSRSSLDDAVQDETNHFILKISSDFIMTLWLVNYLWTVVSLAEFSIVQFPIICLTSKNSK